MTSTVVTREERKVKYKNWTIYFPNRPGVTFSKRVLKEVVQNGKAGVTVADTAPYKAVLTWPKPVVLASVERLIKLALEKDDAFTFLHPPRPMEDHAGLGDATAAPSGWEGATAEACPPAVPTLPHGDVAASSGEAASAHGVPDAPVQPAARAAQREPAATQDLKRRRLVRKSLDAHSAPLLPSAALALKLESLCEFVVEGESTYARPSNNFDVDWQTCLGAGSFGEVYAGRGSADPSRQVAIKLFVWGSQTRRRQDATAEVRRFAAVDGHPKLVQLLDVGYFDRPQRSAAIGLVLDLYDLDVREFLKLRPLRLAGMRAVLSSVLEALGHIHERGLVHADVKPANVLMRGAGASREWLRTLRRGAAPANEADPVEVVYQLPMCFQDSRGTQNVKRPRSSNMCRPADV